MDQGERVQHYLVKGTDHHPEDCEERSGTGVEVQIQRRAG